MHYNSIPMRLRFKFLSEWDTSPSDIRILFTDHSKAYIGRQAEAYPGQPTMWLNMHPRLHTQDAARDKVQADVLHEFGHALGLVHEHKHPQCKAKWNYGQLMDRNRWDLDLVRRNYDDDTSSAINARWDRAYDSKSIMHYAIARGDTQSGLREVPENIVLSDGDKETLALIYPSVAVVKEHSTVPKEPTKGHVKEKREKKIRPEKLKPSQKSHISGNNSAVVCGGYVKVSGNASVTIHGGGEVVVSGNSKTVVYGDSTVRASENAYVYVNGGGSARVSGNAAVEFSGTATGDVTENGSIRWNV
ncbi:hypothetical protein CNMCM8927_003894 [Aspergillus lentulus]|uniref:Peptidase M12A domain-containing protein n=1 Tax=Aspergillus lentulus TaxID=293939 RepID=A0AAN6BRN8_ASPLE|nr:hypothetical protein CNMCM8927_003894 [Aspergillus lentulus]GFF58696.1 hypothetical protein IFM62136_03891 [Aspergillus lentulus]